MQLSKILFPLLLLITFCQMSAQQTLVDTIGFEWTNASNSFWGITDVNGMLHLGSDAEGAIYEINADGELTNTIETPPSIDFNHGMVWDGEYYWVAEDYTTNGASLFQLEANGGIVNSFVLPEQIGGNSSGIGGLSMDGNDIWFTVYYPDFDEYPFGYAYKINPNTQAILDTLPLYGQQVYGIATYDNYIFYVTDDLNGDEERIYCYSKVEEDILFFFPLIDPDGDSSPRGLHWFDGHLWLLGKRPGPSAFEYSMLYKYSMELETSTFPEMSLNTNNLNFGAVPIDYTESQEFYIINNGTANLNINAFTTNGDAFSYSIEEELPFSIVPNDSIAVTITFSPSAETNYENAFNIVSNGLNNPTQSINLSGEGIVNAPEIFVSENSLDFAFGLNDRNFYILNNGVGVLEIFDITFSPEAPFYILNQEFPFSIGTGDSVLLTIVSDPMMMGTYESVLIINSNSLTNSTQTIDLFGEFIMSVETLEKNHKISVHPNPVEDQLFLNLENIDQKINQISLYNIQGKRIKVLSENLQNYGDQTLSFNVKSLNPGTYFVLINLENKTAQSIPIIIK